MGLRTVFREICQGLDGSFPLDKLNGERSYESIVLQRRETICKRDEVFLIFLHCAGIPDLNLAG